MRPDTVRPPARRARLRLTLGLVALTLPFGWASYKAVTRPRCLDLACWDLDQLERYLQEQGLGLRRVAPTRMPAMVPCMFLTRTDKTWDQLEHVAKGQSMIDEWQGTVYCEKWLNASGRNFQAAIWGDCCLQAGPYLFFGDRTILAEIHLALQ